MYSVRYACKYNVFYEICLKIYKPSSYNNKIIIVVQLKASVLNLISTFYCSLMEISSSNL